jgi:hypothetical protein
MRIKKSELRNTIREVIIGRPEHNSPLVYESIFGLAWKVVKNHTLDIVKDYRDMPAIKKAHKEVESKTGSNMSKVEDAGTADAWKLFNAMHGIGTNEDDVTEVIQRRSQDLNILSNEYQKLMDNLAKLNGNIKNSAAEVIDGAKNGAIVAGSVAAPLMIAATVMSVVTGGVGIGVGAALAGVGATVLGGAKIGAAIKGVKEIASWSETTLNSGKGLAQMLEEEGMSEEAEKVKSALKENRRIRAKRILESSRTFRKIQRR